MNTSEEIDVRISGSRSTIYNIQVDFSIKKYIKTYLFLIKIILIKCTSVPVGGPPSYKSIKYYNFYCDKD